jgi:tetratricopeptide (TPR) repeat protein
VSSSFSTLPLSDRRALEGAEGWLGLGNWREAENELASIAPDLQTHPDVIELRWHIHAAAKRWQAAVDVAETLVGLAPERVNAWVHRSFALHELKRTQEAYDKLVPAAESFSKVWTVPYNLACYCAQLGRLQESRTWLKKALSIDKIQANLAAIEDPDLKPLREPGFRW